MSVYIKSILPDKMKIKLVVVNKNLNQKMRFEPHYFVTRGRWTGGSTPPRKAASRSKRCFEAGLSGQEFCACKFLKLLYNNYKVKFEGTVLPVPLFRK